MISGLTGVRHSLEIPVDFDKLQAWRSGATKGHIQDVFPELNADQREFLMTGITPEEWDQYIKDPNDGEAPDSA
jgi:hypothetical protein